MTFYFYWLLLYNVIICKLQFITKQVGSFYGPPVTPVYGLWVEKERPKGVTGMKNICIYESIKIELLSFDFDVLKPKSDQILSWIHFDMSSRLKEEVA